ncbi:TPA: iron ABC transporter permease [Streptococcus equi subsp. zooepidemicus]|nr:iron ABC transporter permease [Streptococcus equi subsp. zooepidemicus]HEL0039504.1 iron ABC transporter permease [Streptococcus equi subsp. zooepidemicus]HEL0041537.1 iron ABC transporter permease [Streptococcus equi subsp. zooepidemicus]HEL0043593.1 iron ABC transporter permease [Streptococcus equi subsp. zooepidemicus]HEL0051584.1 iron ABC transporter permease [Streptococcus equi subsp. zooepidemicus]
MTATKRHVPLFLGLIAGLVCLMIISLSIGDSSMSPLEVIRVLFGKSTAAMTLIITNIRLPRILAACIGGGSLALSGLLLQSLTRNPLADSGILGINAGAGMAITLVISYSTSDSLISRQWLPLMTISGAMATIVLVYLLSLSHGRINPIRLIVTGVGVSSMLSSLMIAFVGNVNRYKVDYVIHWLSGQLTGDDWSKLSIVAPLLGITWLLAFSQAYKLNIMALNDEASMALGFKLHQYCTIVLALSAILSALSVILVGNITFIGLIAGHTSKRLVGANHRLSLPVSLFIGMILLLLADTIGRVYLVGSNIPTGILVSIIGAPYFLYLMVKMT